MGLTVLSCLVLYCSLLGIMTPVSAKKPDPWLLNIEFYDHHGSAPKCLGVLISRLHVIALCSHRKDNAHIQSLNGDVDIDITDVAYHSPDDTDIIVIELDDEITVGPKIHPACIAPSDLPYSGAIMYRETRSWNNEVVNRHLFEAGKDDGCPKEVNTLCAKCGEEFTVQYAGDPVVFLHSNANKVYLLALDTRKLDCNSRTGILQYSRMTKIAAQLKSITGVTSDEDCKLRWGS